MPWHPDIKRSDIIDEIEESIEIIDVGDGKWYVAEGEYEGSKRAAQGESRQEAISNLVRRFYNFVYRTEKIKNKQEYMDKRMKKQRERITEIVEKNS